MELCEQFTGIANGKDVSELWILILVWLTNGDH
jgi:hypothetical protein